MIAGSELYLDRIKSDAVQIIEVLQNHSAENICVDCGSGTEIFSHPVSLYHQCKHLLITHSASFVHFSQFSISCGFTFSLLRCSPLFLSHYALLAALSCGDFSQFQCRPNEHSSVTKKRTADAECDSTDKLSCDFFHIRETNVSEKDPEPFALFHLLSCRVLLVHFTLFDAFCTYLCDDGTVTYVFEYFWAFLTFNSKRECDRRTSKKENSHLIWGRETFLNGKMKMFRLKHLLVTFYIAVPGR